MNRKEQKRVLISRPDRLGDVILSTPLPREIKKNFPDSFVAVLVRKYAQAVFENNPFVDKIITIDDFLKGEKGSFWKKWRELRALKFNYALMLLPNEKINYLLFAAGIKNRIGVGNKFYQWITNVKGISRNKYKPLRHEADYCLDLARAMGVESFNYKTEIYLSEEEKGRVEKLRTELAPNGERIIAVHISSGKSCPNWKPERYLELIEKLKANSKIRVIVTDVNLPQEVESKLSGVFRVGEGLRELFVALKASDLLISASTGPSHAAAALGTPTLTLFCRMPACSPQLWSPMGNDARYVMPSEEYCKNNCPGNPKVCSFENGGIAVENVLTKVSDFSSKML